MKFLLRHLATVHSSRPGFLFCCGLNGCQRSFRNITTYKHHVYARHSTNLDLSTSQDSSDQQAGDQQAGDSDSDYDGLGADYSQGDEGNSDSAHEGRNDGDQQTGINKAVCMSVTDYSFYSTSQPK